MVFIFLWRMGKQFCYSKSPPKEEVGMINIYSGGGCPGQQRNSTLSSTQQDRQAAQTAWKNFQTELTPDQQALQQKLIEDQFKGASPEQSQKDQKAFFSSLNSQEQSDFGKAIQASIKLGQEVSPQQQCPQNGSQINFPA